MVAKLVLAVIVGFLVTGFTFAQSGSSPSRTAKMDRHFSYTDTNGDEFIGRAEAALYPALVKDFNAIDFNKDGKLSRQEMQAYRLGTYRTQRAANAGRKPKVAENDNDDTVTKADAEGANPTSRKNF